MAVLPDGALVTGHPDTGMLALFATDGRLVQTLDTGLTGCMAWCWWTTRVRSACGWPTTVASSCRLSPPTPTTWRPVGSFNSTSRRITAELMQPDIAAYETKRWAPCAVTVDEPVHGGDGRIWVAYGYGESLLHCYASSGTYLFTLDGSESGTVFDSPRGVLIDRRKPSPELYVADRSNRRLVVYSADGSFLRSIATDALTSPSALTIAGDTLVVAEFFGAITALGVDDSPIGGIGDESVTTRPGWPNRLDGGTRGPHLRATHFNSPHGIAADTNGNIFVAEWLVSGWLVQLELLAADRP